MRPLSYVPGADIDDDSFPDKSFTTITYRGLQESVLGGMLLSELGADEVAKPRGKTAVVKAESLYCAGGGGGSHGGE